MRAILLLTLAVTVLVAILPNPIPQHPSMAPGSGLVTASASSSVQVQQTSTANAFLNAGIFLWHNSTTSNKSYPKSYPVNLTGYTSISYSQMTFSVSAGPYVPQVNIGQGGATLVNSTILGQYGVTPTIGNVPVSLKPVALFNQTGGPVLHGTYLVYANETQSITFINTQARTWTLNSTYFTMSFTMTASYGYWVNSTQVYFPFAIGSSVNYTSVAVNGSSGYQVGYAGVYADNASLAPGKSLTMTVTYYPVPINSGPAAIITLGPPHLIAGTTQSYTEFGNYTDAQTLPYEGIYFLKFNFSYPIDPSPIYLYSNGRTVSSSTFSLQNTALIVVPNTLLIGVGKSVLFEVNFTSLLSPPAASLFPGTVVFSVGNLGITFAEILATLMVAGLAIFLAFIIVHQRYDTTVRSVAYDVTASEVILVIFWILSAYGHT